MGYAESNAMRDSLTGRCPWSRSASETRVHSLSSVVVEDEDFLPSDYDLDSTVVLESTDFEEISSLRAPRALLPYALFIITSLGCVGVALAQLM